MSVLDLNLDKRHHSFTVKREELEQQIFRNLLIKNCKGSEIQRITVYEF